MKKFDVKLQGTDLVAGFDGNEDGEKSVSLSVKLGEIYQELMAKGEAKMDVKTLSVKRDGGKVTLLLDTDKDGEPVLELSFDLVEGLEEAF